MEQELQMQGAAIQNAPVVEEEAENVDPQLKGEVENYILSIMHIMHNPKTSKSVMSMLSSAPPEQSIPETTLYLNSVVEKAFREKGSKEPSDDVKIAGAMYAISDLSLLGNSARVWDVEVGEDQMQKLLSDTVKKYVRKGLAEGSIDPIELQKVTEPLLSPEQKELGLSFAKSLELPEAPTESMAMDVYAKRKTQPLEQENAKLKSLIDQQKQAEQQPQQQPQVRSPYGL